MKQIDLLAKVSSIIGVFVLILIFLKVENLEKRENFYQYDNRKINLMQLKEIEAGIDYIITYKEDSYIELFRKHTLSLSQKSIDEILQRLHKANRSEYYSAELVAYMMFDNEKIELFHSKRYLKRVDRYSVNEYMLKVLKAQGIDAFQYKSIASLKGKVFDNKENFLDEVVSAGKLKKEGWCEENIPVLGLSENGIRFMNSIDLEDKDRPLTKEDIKMIEASLNRALKVYESIQ